MNPESLFNAVEKKKPVPKIAERCKSYYLQNGLYLSIPVRHCTWRPYLLQYVFYLFKLWDIAHW